MKQLAALIVVVGLGCTGCGQKAPVVWPPTVPGTGTNAVSPAEQLKTMREAEKFAGTWLMRERNGQKPEGRKWVFTTEMIVDWNGTISREGTFKVDPEKKHLDFLVDEKVKFAGIYEFTDGNQKLKFCGAEVPPGKDKEERRPTEFKLQKGWVLYLLERAK